MALHFTQPKQTILYVDDDRAVSGLIAGMLNEAGFHVLTAVDAEHALRLIGSNDISALVTDIVMPGKNGIELAQEAKRLRPTLKVMFVTGYPQRAADPAAMRLGNTLVKPVRAGEVVQAVKSLVPA